MELLICFAEILAFGIFAYAINIKTSEKWLKLLTIILIVLSLIAMALLIFGSMWKIS